MRLRSLACLIAGLALVIVLFGCGASTQQSGSSLSRTSGSDTQPSITGGSGSAVNVQAADKATASEVNYFGWKAFKLTNGLVTVIAVPDIGGRIVEYKLGAHPFLWVNPDELGKLYDAPKSEGARKWHNFGGYKVWPSPQKDWGGPPDPLGSTLDEGRWQGKLLSKEGQSVSVQMTSPADATGTGLQITRLITLQVNTTRLSVKETFQNVSKRAVTWGIWDVTQVPGSLAPDAKFNSEAKIYFPLNEKSKHPNGYFSVVGEDSGQWKTVANGKVLEVSYGGKVGKIAADSNAGWIAYVDALHEFAFAKTFDVIAGAKYPDEDSTVEVYTSAAKTPYMEMEVLAPVKKLEPGEKTSFEFNWGATKIGGPIVKVTDAAAIKVHPTAAKQGNNVVVTGEIGVFAPGQVALEFRNKDGKTISTSAPMPVTPGTSVALRLVAAMPADATSAMVVLNGSGGVKLGNIAEVPLSTKLAKAN